MKKTIGMIFGVLVIAALSGCANGPLAVKDAWARPGVAGGNSAVYFVVDNPKAEADSLLSASTPAASVVEIHETIHHADDTMSMTPQSEIPIPARSTVNFEPGGKHLMLINLPLDLKAGEMIQVTLTFANAGNIELEVPIREP